MAQSTSMGSDGEDDKITEVEDEMESNKETSCCCSFCGKSFKKKKYLKIHERSHTGENLFPCDVCGKAFTSRRSLKTHLLTHTGEKPFSCSKCDRSFSRLIHLQTHERTHTGERPFECKFCHKCFSAKKTMQTHERLHTGEKPYHCNTCGSKFSQLGHLKRHQLVHTGERPFICDTCKKSFSDSRTLQNHVRIHTGDKPYMCHICSKSFTQLGHLRRHDAIHTGAKNYICSICSKAFTQMSTLKKHELIHTNEKPYSCKVCSKSFTQLSQLKSHKYIHSGDRPKPFVCQYCDKSFPFSCLLKEHEPIHTGQSQNVCDVCHKTFSRKSHLKRHQLMHSGIKPHKCKHCVKSFNRLDRLNQHVKKEHNVDAKLGKDQEVDSSRDTGSTEQGMILTNISIQNDNQNGILNVTVPISDKNVQRQGTSQNIFCKDAKIQEFVPTVTPNSFHICSRCNRPISYAPENSELLCQCSNLPKTSYLCQYCLRTFECIELLKAHESCCMHEQMPPNWLPDVPTAMIEQQIFPFAVQGIQSQNTSVNQDIFEPKSKQLQEKMKCKNANQAAFDNFIQEEWEQDLTCSQEQTDPRNPFMVKDVSSPNVSSNILPTENVLETLEKTPIVDESLINYRLLGYNNKRVKNTGIEQEHNDTIKKLDSELDKSDIGCKEKRSGDEKDMVDVKEKFENNSDADSKSGGEISKELDEIQLSEKTTEKVKSQKKKGGKKSWKVRLNKSEVIAITENDYEDMSNDIKEMKAHQKKNNKKGEFVCSFCGKKLKSRDGLSHHERQHTGKKLQKCQDCGKTFSTSKDLQTHQRTHTGEKPFMCEVCSKSFSQLAHLLRHKYIHTGEKPFSCNVCSKSFSQQSTLAKHVLIHSGKKPFVCDTCGKGFTQQSNLRVHLFTHGGEKPKPHICKHCGKAFTYLCILKEHELVHQPDNPNSCTTCGKSFSRKDHLRRHLKTHTGERPYICEVCNKSYARLDRLKEHQRKGHGEKDYNMDQYAKKDHNSKIQENSHTSAFETKIHQIPVAKNSMDIDQTPDHRNIIESKSFAAIQSSNTTHDIALASVMSQPGPSDVNVVPNLNHYNVKSDQFLPLSQHPPTGFVSYAKHQVLQDLSTKEPALQDRLVAEANLPLGHPVQMFFPTGL